MSAPPHISNAVPSVFLNAHFRIVLFALPDANFVISGSVSTIRSILFEQLGYIKLQPYTKQLSPLLKYTVVAKNSIFLICKYSDALTEKA